MECWDGGVAAFPDARRSGEKNLKLFRRGSYAWNFKAAVPLCADLL